MKFYLLCLLLFVAFFIACGGGINSSNNSKTISSTPIPSAPSTPRAATSPTKILPKIVAFGDSLTAGYGLEPAESYPALLQKKLQADGYDYEVVNSGISGDTTAGGLRRIDWALEANNVKVLILELGANDLLRGQPVKEMKKNLDAIITRAQAKGAVVLLAGMYAPTSSGIEYEREVRDAFQALAREHHVAMIPFFLDRVAGIESLNQADGIHPNAEGSKIVAETIYGALRPLLDKR
jgi:acyl-CoA thioesterase-1